MVGGDFGGLAAARVRTLLFLNSLDTVQRQVRQANRPVEFPVRHL
jgi:hypothetical protein